MKVKHIFFIFFIFLHYNLSSQTVISYGYDNASNRILRGGVSIPLGATITKPIPIGTLANGSSYSHTENNNQVNNFGDYFNGATNQKSDEIFYQFTAATNGILNLSLCNSGLADTYLHLLNSNGDEIANNDDYCVTKSAITQTISAGTYYVVTEGKGTAVGSITLDISMAAPVGALLSNPIAMGTMDAKTYTATSNNTTINGYGNDYTGADNQVSDDIFYSFSITSPQKVSISTCGSLFDTYLHLLNSSGALITSNNDAATGLCTSSTTASNITTVLQPGTYYAVVEGAGSNAGNINLSVSAQFVPIGALFSYPISIVGLMDVRSYSTTANNSVSNYYGNDYTGNNNQSSDDIFYSFNISKAQVVTISTCGSSLDTYLHLLNSTGGSIASDDDDNLSTPKHCTGNGTSSYISKTLQAGTYYVVVEGYSGSTGSISLNITTTNPPPIGAFISNPIAIGVMDNRTYNYTVDNSPVNGYGNDYIGSDNQASDDVFFSFTLSSTQYVKISTCGGTIDTYLHLLNSSGTMIYYNDDAQTDCPSYSFASVIRTVQLSPGTYYVVVEGFLNRSGSIPLTLSSTGNEPKSMKIDDKKEEQVEGVTCYPNPVTDQLNVVSTIDMNTIEIYSITGIKLKSFSNVNASLKMIDLSDFKMGVYLLVVSTEKERKIMKIEKD